MPSRTAARRARIVAAMDLSEQELERLDSLPPEERAAELESIEQRLRASLEETAEA